jgi:GTP-binding protein
VAKGGNGGFGNARFKTQWRTAPQIANDGQTGEEFKIELELKVLADVGLVGFPNAGKSTFISKISNSRPKIADYPFTTLVPNLGIVKYGEYKSFVMADIPGLIQGASDGKGLGNQFLRHIERTEVLVYLVDCTAKNIQDEFSTLQNELKKHKKELIERPSLLLLTKSDLVLDEPVKVKNFSINIPVIQISSVTGENLNEAVQSMAHIIHPKVSSK